MGDTINLRVDKSLQQVLEDIRKSIAGDLKEKYKLDEIKIYGTLASQILAAKMQGRKILNFKIRKLGLNKGVLELIG